jgi:group I intron endonuclease
MTRVSCIYKIINPINRKFYIGSPVNFASVKNKHFPDLLSVNPFNLYLQKAHDKNSFNSKILEIVNMPNVLIDREQFYLDLLKLHNEHVAYNISITEAGIKHGINLGSITQVCSVDTSVNIKMINKR